MNKLPELQPAYFYALRSNPEISTSEGVGIRTALRQMVTFLQFYSELALSLTHPLIVGKYIQTTPRQGTPGRAGV